jgi:hypothetical protein
METINNFEENKPRFNIGFFFLCLGLLITLITSVVSLLNLAFNTLDERFPDVLNSSYRYGYSTYDFEEIRIALATLIIFFPIFVLVFYFWKKFIKSGIGPIDEKIKKWMIYIILFLSAVVIAVDLAVLVKYFVSGEITNRFVYKVLITFVTAIILGKYFYVSEFWRGKEIFKKINSISCPILGTLLVLLAIIFSFCVMGSPAKQRSLRLDDRRVGDLQNIQYQVINYWQQKEKLPETLKDLANPMTGFSLPVPPNFEKGEQYEYLIKDKKNLTFDLCATFSLPMPKSWQEYQNDSVVFPIKTEVGLDGASYPVPIGESKESWNHETGRTCFERTIDKDIYPPFSK